MAVATGCVAVGVFVTGVPVKVGVLVAGVPVLVAVRVLVLVGVALGSP